MFGGSTGITTDPDLPKPNPKQKSWFPVIAGAVTFFIVFGGIATGWFFGNRDETQTEPVATEATQESKAKPAATEAEKPTVLAKEDSPSAKLLAAAASTNAPTVPAPAATKADPTNCVFVNGNRPQVGTKFILTCDGGTFIATATYKDEGFFVFSDFESHTY